MRLSVDDARNLIKGDALILSQWTRVCLHFLYRPYGTFPRMHVAGLLKENREIAILNSRKPQMHSEDILAPELCQQLRPVRRSSSLQVLATRSRCFTEDDIEYARLRSSRGNLICIIFKGL